MNNDQYNDFLGAALNLVGEMARENVELIETDGSRVEIDPECELWLCVQNPEKSEQIKNILAEFNKHVAERCSGTVMSAPRIRTRA